MIWRYSLVDNIRMALDNVRLHDECGERGIWLVEILIFVIVVVVVQMTDEQGLMNIQILKIIIMNTQCMTKDECY